MIWEASDAKGIASEQAQDSELIKGVDTDQMADEGRTANQWFQ